MLEQIERLAAEHRPDAILVSGDVYHTTTPTAAAQQMFVGAMMALHTLVPEMQIIVTAGNHDSASRHEVFRQPWKTLNVHTISSVNSGLTVDLPGKGHVVAVPYVNEHYLNDGFYQALLDTVPNDGLPVVMMAHSTVSSELLPLQTENSEQRTPNSELSVGGIDAVPLSFFGEGYDYLALGHIHGGYFLPGSNGRARYCGTPLPVSFDETGEHSVTLVEIGSRGDSPKVSIIPIDNPHPLVTLPEEGFVAWDEAVAMLSQYDAESPAYVRLNVEVDDFLPAGANAEAAQTVKEKQCRFCYINTRRCVHAGTSASQGLTVSEFRQESPLSLVRRYAADKGMVFDDELADLFNSLL